VPPVSQTHFINFSKSASSSSAQFKPTRYSFQPQLLRIKTTTLTLFELWIPVQSLNVQPTALLLLKHVNPKHWTRLPRSNSHVISIDHFQKCQAINHSRQKVKSQSNKSQISERFPSKMPTMSQFKLILEKCCVYKNFKSISLGIPNLTGISVTTEALL